MLETAWLIISAMAFGGAMAYMGLLSRWIRRVVDWARGDRRLYQGHETDISRTSLGLLAHSAEPRMEFE